MELESKDYQEEWWQSLSPSIGEGLCYELQTKST